MQRIQENQLSIPSEHQDSKSIIQPIFLRSFLSKDNLAEAKKRIEQLERILKQEVYTKQELINLVLKIKNQSKTLGLKADQLCCVTAYALIKNFNINSTSIKKININNMNNLENCISITKNYPLNNNNKNSNYWAQSFKFKDGASFNSEITINQFLVNDNPKDSGENSHSEFFTGIEIDVDQLDQRLKELASHEGRYAIFYIIFTLCNKNKKKIEDQYDHVICAYAANGTIYYLETQATGSKDEPYVGSSIKEMGYGFMNITKNEINDFYHNKIMVFLAGSEKRHKMAFDKLQQYINPVIEKIAPEETKIEIEQENDDKLTSLSVPKNLVTAIPDRKFDFKFELLPLEIYENLNLLIFDNKNTAANIQKLIKKQDVSKVWNNCIKDFLDTSFLDSLTLANEHQVLKLLRNFLRLDNSSPKDIFLNIIGMNKENYNINMAELNSWVTSYSSGTIRGDHIKWALVLLLFSDSFREIYQEQINNIVNALMKPVGIDALWYFLKNDFVTKLNEAHANVRLYKGHEIRPPDFQIMSGDFYWVFTTISKILSLDKACTPFDILNALKENCVNQSSLKPLLKLKTLNCIRPIFYLLIMSDKIFEKNQDILNELFKKIYCYKSKEQNTAIPNVKSNQNQLIIKKKIKIIPQEADEKTQEILAGRHFATDDDKLFLSSEVTQNRCFDKKRTYFIYNQNYQIPMNAIRYKDTVEKRVYALLVDEKDNTTHAIRIHRRDRGCRVFICDYTHNGITYPRGETIPPNLLPTLQAIKLVFKTDQAIKRTTFAPLRKFYTNLIENYGHLPLTPVQTSTGWVLDVSTKKTKEQPIPSNSIFSPHVNNSIFAPNNANNNANNNEILNSNSAEPNPHKKRKVA